MLKKLVGVIISLFSLGVLANSPVPLEISGKKPWYSLIKILLGLDVIPMFKLPQKLLMRIDYQFWFCPKQPFRH